MVQAATQQHVGQNQREHAGHGSSFALEEAEAEPEHQVEDGQGQHEPAVVVGQLDAGDVVENLGGIHGFAQQKAYRQIHPFHHVEGEDQGQHTAAEEAFQIVRLALPAHIEAVAGADEEKRNKEVADGHKEIQTRTDKLFVGHPRGAGFLARMVQQDADGKEALPHLALIQREEVLVPFVASVPFAAPHQRQQHQRVDQIDQFIHC